MTARALTRTLRTIVPFWARGKTVVRVYDPATKTLRGIRKADVADGSVILELER